MIISIGLLYYCSNERVCPYKENVQMFVFVRTVRQRSTICNENVHVSKRNWYLVCCENWVIKRPTYQKALNLEILKNRNWTVAVWEREKPIRKQNANKRNAEPQNKKNVWIYKITWRKILNGIVMMWKNNEIMEFLIRACLSNLVSIENS